MKRGWKYLKEQLRQPLVAGVVGVIFLLIIGAGAYATIGGSSPFAANPVNLQKGLVGWWKMDGNTKDATPYGNNASLLGATPPALTADREGKANSAYFFDGSTSYATMPNASGRFIPTDNASFSISMFVKPTGAVSDPSYVALISNESYLTDGFRFALGSTPKFGFWTTQSGGTIGITGATTAVSGQWYHLAVVYDGTTARLYVNGVQDAMGTGIIKANTRAVNLSNIGGSTKFQGNMDDVRLYNRNLSATEVTALYKQYDPAVKAAADANGLIGQWKFNGNYKDATPLANNLTVNGTTLVADRKGSASSALNSNGTSDYVYGRIGNGTYFGGNNPLTVSAWVYVTATSSGPIFGMTAAPPGGGWNMPFLSLNGTTVYGWIYNNTPISTTAAANQWHHIAMTYNPGGSPTTILYMDGQPAGTATGTYAAGGANYFTTYLTGVKPNAGVANFLNTPISDVRAYSRVLSAADVTAQYNSYNSQLSIGGSGAPGSVSLGKGLVGDWAMNGNSKDATPYGNDGAATSATLTTDRKGRVNSAYGFSGISGQGIFLPTTGKYTAFGTASYTVGAWIKTTDAGGQKCIMSTAGSSQGWRFGYGGGLPYFLVGDGPHYQEGAIGTTTLNDGNWHYLAITYAYAANWSVTAYIDGVQTGNINLPATIGSVNDTSAVIGSMGGGSAGMVIGSVDDVRVYNRALSAAEIASLYTNYR